MPGTVNVYCKLPHGLQLQLYRKTAGREPIMGGGFRDVDVYQPEGPRVTIVGSAYPQDRGPTHPLSKGFAITRDVDADFMAAWMKANADMDIVKKGLIFFHEKQASGDAMSKERQGERSGLERLDPTDKKMMPQGVSTADEQARA